MKLLLHALPLAILAATASADVRLTRLADRVRVEVDGTLFTEYVFGDGASRPYCYPILLADGTGLTRDYPMKKTPGEDRDHPHHRALMFAHGDANKIDFWNEGKAGPPLPKGRTEHFSLGVLGHGDEGQFQTRNRWLAPDGRVIATDLTTLTFRDAGGGNRTLDYGITIYALPGEPLVLGDTKEGTMAIRVAQWLTPPHRLSGKEIPGTGRIVNAAGDRDAAAWGKRAAWCAYSGEHGGKTYGVAIFDHPQNLRHPTWWMARDYGLFAANPFGQHDFESTKEKPLPPGLGNHTIPAGGSLTLRYRFFFHEGDPATAKLADHYAAYAAGR
ncbi:MAG: PmoA family protein [Lacunisphaera sp.]|nr:PmoA family protein [Lacunisphaera sp.]